MRKTPSFLERVRNAVRRLLRRDAKPHYGKYALYGALAVVLMGLMWGMNGDLFKTSLFSTSQKARIYEIAKSKLNKPYVWGAEGPDSFDCSGFTQFVLKNAVGVNLVHSSREQAKVGRAISYDNLGVGDLVFFATDGAKPGEVNHVGVVSRVEGGKKWMIHANSYYSKVVEEELNAAYWQKTYLFGREITGATKDLAANATTFDASKNPVKPSATGLVYAPGQPTFPNSGK